MRAEQKSFGHDAVSVLVLFEVLSVDGVSRDIARKAHTRLHVIVLQEGQQLEAILAHEGDGHPVLGRVVYGQDNVFLHVLQVVQVALENGASLWLDLVDAGQLSQAKGGVHLAALHVVAHGAVQELVVVRYAVDAELEAGLDVFGVVADAAPIAEHARSLHKLLIVEHHHTLFVDFSIRVTFIL